MFLFDEYSRFEFGDMTAVYFLKNKQMMFTVVPTDMVDSVPDHRTDICDTIAHRSFSAASNSKPQAALFDNMLQVHFQGDGYPNAYFAGNSMLDTETSRSFEFVSQSCEGNVIKTVMSNALHDIIATHILTFFPDKPYFTINVELENVGFETLVMDEFNSFTLGMLSPFAPDEGSDRYKLHRATSFWSGEGRLVADDLEDLGMEPAWTPYLGRVSQWGNNSAMPVKHYFPLAGFEDCAAGVVWGVQLCALGPWQMELMRRGDFVNLTGGLPEGCNSAYNQKLYPKQKVSGIPAVITVVKGDMTAALNRLKRYPQDNNIGYSPYEDDCPPIYNDWCTNWGRHTEEKLLKIADVLQGRGLKYFVVDSGWYCNQGGKNQRKGDWQVDPDRFPNGMKYFCDEIRKRGFIPGIWFEVEQFHLEGTQIIKDHPDWVLTCHGVPYTTDGAINVFDFRKKEVRDYMHTKVTDFLLENNIRYIKTDYNYAMAGADSQNGSTLYGVCEFLEGVEIFFREMKERIPDLTVEICASGGSRLTPAWMSLGDIASVTDVHEDITIPIVGANTALMIPLRANQTWATLRAWNDEKRNRYLMTGGMIGRMGLSGDIVQLNDEQLELVQEGLDFCVKLKDLILNGFVSLDRRMKNKAWNNPKGCQIFRVETDKELLLVVHTFADSDQSISIDIPQNAVVSDIYKRSQVVCSQEDSKIILNNYEDFEGVAILLEKQ